MAAARSRLDPQLYPVLQGVHTHLRIAIFSKFPVLTGDDMSEFGKTFGEVLDGCRSVDTHKISVRPEP
jgi:hypothetical protein